MVATERRADELELRVGGPDIQHVAGDGRAATTTTPVYFGMVLDWADTPGSYSATLTYTIATQ